MAEYIEKEALHNEITAAQKTLESDNDDVWRRNKNYFKSLAWAHQIIRAAPAAEVEPVVHARWIKFYRTSYGVVVGEDTVCSNCHNEAEILQAGGGCDFTPPRCPYCGAHMGGELDG